MTPLGDSDTAKSMSAMATHADRGARVATGSSSCSSSSSLPMARRVARGARTVVPRAARSSRASKDPSDFNGDYDAIRASLMAEKPAVSIGIATTLNWLSELSFGSPAQRRVVGVGVDAVARAYGRFIDALPYKRQDGRDVPRRAREGGIDEAAKIWRAQARGAETTRLADVKAYWHDKGMQDGFATYTAEYVLTLANAVRNGTIARGDVEVQSLVSDVFELSARAETVAAICLCSIPEALKLSYGYPEILVTPSSAIVSRLAALKTMMPGADVALIMRLNAKAFLERDVVDIKRRFDALQTAFPGVKVGKLIEHDPELLLIDVDAGVAALRELWTPEQFSRSDDDNPFFAEELALAIRAVSGNGPEQYGG